MDRRALHHALESGGGLRLGRAVGREAREILVEELHEFAAQLVEVHAARAQHRGRVAVVDQAEQQVLEGRVFVAALAREAERAVERLF